MMKWANRSRMRGLLHDAHSLYRFGRNAPFRSQRIWVNPSEVSSAVDGLRRSFTGCVIGGDWDRDQFSVEDIEKVRFCRLHWEHGLPWEATGAYDFTMRMIREHGGRFDACETLADVAERYGRLDDVFQQVRVEGRLRTAAELGTGFREQGGVYIHIDRDCRPVFSLRGNHRLAIARVLGLPMIPAQLGVVHLSAVETWREKYVKERDQSGASARIP